MNHILKLQRDLNLSNHAVRAAMLDLDKFRVFLHSAKFTGTEGGERKDWIATGDVLLWIEQTMNHILEAADTMDCEPFE